MAYSINSDIPIPYGRTIPLPKPLLLDTVDPEKALRQMVPFWRKKQYEVLAAIVISDCIRIRKLILAKLSKLLQIDIQMRWCTNSGSKYLQPDSNNTQYIFYLSFENSNCPQYFTEKCFYNAYSKGAIPVILGPPYDDCFKLLPPNSFIHVDSYKTIDDLAKHITNRHKWFKYCPTVTHHTLNRTRKQVAMWRRIEDGVQQVRSAKYRRMAVSLRPRVRPHQQLMTPSAHVSVRYKQLHQLLH
ncbi:3-galactosyl-N-acetylglucosaminide 4-alpha-L-fucosyltransferase FUT3-like [Pectinophora gossypiella]|uniref:3-galactosyl-N-acetylglucosaminide 4-alpha-L-fucosyltransferase FUT3-like n=1 Tax=Pectinophora gossypiella TaxID=13191 RepID=UPI00214E58AB|nr:3-galactosyl-N-acetylglucosaminide 4-alpha-L-fucosyltransferase FUT3-like [Pectinophora gossypiella]